MKQLTILVLYCVLYGAVGFTLGEQYGEINGSQKLLAYQKTNPPPIPLMTTRHAPVIMRDARVICLSAILQKTQPENWDAMVDAMVRSPNVCLVAEFMYPGRDVPEHSPEAETQAAAKAIDNG